MRQDEFTVRTGRHKSLRRVFLFEELLLFSKPRRGPTGIDTFAYKRSFKMADLGLTECCEDNNLRFEIWFRRRKARDTFVLQAASLATKQAWTADISRLLWKQAVHNKEVRMAEMTSMGVGNKTFRDIAPNEEAINDRTINYVLKCRAPEDSEVSSQCPSASGSSGSDSSFVTGQALGRGLEDLSYV